MFVRLFVCMTSKCLRFPQRTEKRSRRFWIYAFYAMYNNLLNATSDIFYENKSQLKCWEVYNINYNRNRLNAKNNWFVSFYDSVTAIIIRICSVFQDCFSRTENWRSTYKSWCWFHQQKSVQWHCSGARAKGQIWLHERYNRLCVSRWSSSFRWFVDSYRFVILHAFSPDSPPQLARLVGLIILESK